MPKSNDILEKGQLSILFLKSFLQLENLMKGYGRQSTQGGVTWGFIAGALIYGGSQHMGWNPVLPVAAFVLFDALSATWIGFKELGKWENPAAALGEEEE